MDGHIVRDAVLHVASPFPLAFPSKNLTLSSPPGAGVQHVVGMRRSGRPATRSDVLLSVADHVRPRPGPDAIR